MTKSYFEPIELPVKTGEVKSTPLANDKEEWPEKEKFDIINNRIAEELDSIQSGTSKFTPYGIQLKANEPVMSTFRRFRANPTKENMNSFINLAKQDVGLPAAKYFKMLLNIAIKEDNTNG